MKKVIAWIISMTILIVGFAAGQITWTQVNTGGFGDVENWYGDSMAVYNGNLYVGTVNWTTGAEIWEYDGTIWTQVNTDGFGDVNNLDCSSMAVHNGNLYVGTENVTTGTEVWKYNGTTWTQVNTDGFGLYVISLFSALFYLQNEVTYQICFLFHPDFFLSILFSF